MPLMNQERRQWTMTHGGKFMKPTHSSADSVEDSLRINNCWRNKL